MTKADHLVAAIDVMDQHKIKIDDPSAITQLSFAPPRSGSREVGSVARTFCQLSREAPVHHPRHDDPNFGHPYGFYGTRPPSARPISMPRSMTAISTMPEFADASPKLPLAVTGRER